MIGIHGGLHFNSSEATKHIINILLFKFKIRLSKNIVSVGIILPYSIQTVSQLKCFTASTLVVSNEHN